MPVRRLLQPATPQSPQYFDSLDQLDHWYRGGGTSAGKRDTGVNHTGARMNVDGRGRSKSKLLVCHDYKGGYTDRPFERGYTFEWWHLTEVFIYFSHHRVTIPPDPWIIAAHKHGTKILGVLILEHAQSSPDAVRLVLGLPTESPSSIYTQLSGDDSSPFASLSTHYADALVDLTLARGFDGWLVNVEVPLGIGTENDEGRETYEWGPEHAKALISWVEYFRWRSRQVLGEKSQIVWYDSVTVSGSLRWQNRINPANFAFLAAADSIFTNYHWAPHFPRQDSNLVDAVQKALKDRRANIGAECRPVSLGSIRDAWSSKPNRGRGDVWVGVDIVGRGQYGGGGFSSWKSVEKVVEGVNNENTGLGVAIFAPAWTWENDTDLDRSADARPDPSSGPATLSDVTPPPGCTAWDRWFEDDTYFWTGLPPVESPSRTVPYASPQPTTGNTFRDRVRISREETQRLRQRLLGPLAAPPDSSPRLLPDEKRHRPLAEFFETRPASLATRGRFVTNFCLGSGDGWWEEGEEVLGAPWTDVAMTNPKPDLIWPCPRLVRFSDAAETSQGRARARLTRSSAWSGGNALELILDDRGVSSASYGIPLCIVNVPFGSADALEAEVIWKGEPNCSPPGFYFSIGSPSRATSTPRLLSRSGIASEVPVGGSVPDSVKVDAVDTRSLVRGWHLTSCRISSPGSSNESVSIFGLILTEPSRLLVGQLSLRPLRSDSSPPQASLSDLRWTRVDPPADSDGPRPTAIWGRLSWTASSSDPYAHYVVWATPRSAPSSQAVFLGTTVPSVAGRAEFDVAGLVVEGSEKAVRFSVRAAGGRDADGESVYVEL